MAEYTEKQCPKCGQQLRLPTKVGGVVMACPSCGKEFYSDFKLGRVGRGTRRGMRAGFLEVLDGMRKRIFRS